jgi:hypothetical protein
MFSDLAGTYADDVRVGGICTHPQIIAAITAQCNQSYLPALIEAMLRRERLPCTEL